MIGNVIPLICNTSYFGECVMPKTIQDSLYYSIIAVCHQMAELDSENTSLTTEESPCIENMNMERL